MKLVLTIRAALCRNKASDLEKTVRKIMALLSNLEAQVTATEGSEAAAVAALNGVGSQAKALEDRLHASQVALDAAVAGTVTPPTP